MDKQSRTRVTVELPTEDALALEDLKWVKRKPVAALVREAVRQYLRRATGNEKPT